MTLGISPVAAPTLGNDSYDTCLDVAKEILSRCENAADGFLAHYDGPLHRGTRLQADLEVITLNCSGDTDVSQDAFFA